MLSLRASLKTLLAVVLLAGSRLAAVESIEDIQKDVLADKLVQYLREDIVAKNVAHRFLAKEAQSRPENEASYFYRVGYELNFDDFIEAMSNHYARSLGLEELRTLVSTFEQTDVRATYCALQDLLDEGKPEEIQAEREKIFARHPDAVSVLKTLNESDAGKHLQQVRKDADDLRFRLARAAIRKAYDAARFAPVKEEPPAPAGKSAP
jgi:hypothetical protein